jgi:hypothetical protein
MHVMSGRRIRSMVRHFRPRIAARGPYRSSPNSHLDDDTEQVIAELSDRTWPPYGSCYPEGYELCRRFCAGDPARFRRLLRETLTPADLRSAA